MHMGSGKESPRVMPLAAWKSLTPPGDPHSFAFAVRGSQHQGCGADEPQAPKCLVFGLCSSCFCENMGRLGLKPLPKPHSMSRLLGQLTLTSEMLVSAAVTPNTFTCSWELA